MPTFYEKHNYLDPDFPIFFHHDCCSRENSRFPTHWHEHIELLYITDGICLVCGNGITLKAAPGDVVMISPNCVHDIHAAKDSCGYYCITADKGFCDSFGVPLCRGQFALVLQDGPIRECYESIIHTMQEKLRHYRMEAKALVLRLLILCCRAAEDADMDGKDHAHSPMVTEAINYLHLHFAEALTVDDLCAHLGFSKYYLCRSFKAATGKTIMDYLNYLRCLNARRLIASGQYNISESARRSGFHNMSYFSRTYLKQMGAKPSQARGR